ncbi:MAG TPA: hypothetical protein VFQ35_17100 [Polyangiaceae bacterium]|nr:hypothetical protein [Polyangiaceae bacterium]
MNETLKVASNAILAVLVQAKPANTTSAPSQPGYGARGGPDVIHWTELDAQFARKIQGRSVRPLSQKTPEEKALLDQMRAIQNKKEKRE